MDMSRRVRLACAEGMSQREAARHSGVLRDSVRKMSAFPVPPGYRRTAPVKRPEPDGFTGIIDGWPEGDRAVHRKQRHTAKRVFERLRDGEPVSRHRSEDNGERLHWRLHGREGRHAGARPARARDVCAAGASAGSRPGRFRRGDRHHRRRGAKGACLRHGPPHRDACFVRAYPAAPTRPRGACSGTASSARR